MGIIEYDAADVRDAVMEWKPGPLFGEKRCRDALARHLRSTFQTQASVATEKGVGRGTADIVVDFRNGWGFGTNVAVELKFDLSTLNEYNRLIGQIAGYSQLADVVVVLCGTTDPRMAAQVPNHLKTFIEQKFSTKGYVVLKKTAMRNERGRFTPVM